MKWIHFALPRGYESMKWIHFALPRGYGNLKKIICEKRLNGIIKGNITRYLIKNAA